MMKHLLLCAILIIAAQSIYIPLKSERPRCLSEYLIGSGISTIKLKIGFPKLDNIQPGEHFTVTLRNTETQKISSEIIQPGDKFTKEEALDQSK
jgi:hypothetical protein